MSQFYAVRYDPAALAALGDAVAYIEEHSGPGRAADWLSAMQAGIAKLETLPGAYPIMDEREGRAVHSKLVSSYRVFYFIDEPERIVYVIDIVHTARETKLAPYRGTS
ncbi:MAG: type II toxin-antitoxin system RelE/ParE family toxin [Thermoanaerobaculia bacterium]|nr:type II toxin-antitoxin system RelE/ParE family toxin [Thermoanaerobaculia bacterium]